MACFSKNVVCFLDLYMLSFCFDYFCLVKNADLRENTIMLIYTAFLEICLKAVKRSFPALRKTSTDQNLQPAAFTHWRKLRVKHNGLLACLSCPKK